MQRLPEAIVMPIHQPLLYPDVSSAHLQRRQSASRWCCRRHPTRQVDASFKVSVYGRSAVRLDVEVMASSQNLAVWLSIFFTFALASIGMVVVETPLFCARVIVGLDMVS